MYAVCTSYLFTCLDVFCRLGPYLQSEALHGSTTISFMNTQDLLITYFCFSHALTFRLTTLTVRPVPGSKTPRFALNSTADLVVWMPT